MKSRILLVLVVATILSTLPAHATAGGTALAFNDTLNTIYDNLSGPTATAVCGIAFVVGCITVAFNKEHGPVRSIGIVVLTVAVVAKAPQLLQQLGLTGASADPSAWASLSPWLFAGQVVTATLTARYLTSNRTETI
jgi:type IV secretory pathway VirB2 component (pilin)